MFLVDAPDCDWMPFLFGTVAYIALPFWIFDAAGTHTLRRVSLMPLPQTDRRVRSSVCVCVCNEEKVGLAANARGQQTSPLFPLIPQRANFLRCSQLSPYLRRRRYPFPPPFPSKEISGQTCGSVGIHVSAPKCNTHSTLLRRLDRYSFARAPKMPESFLTFPSPLSLSPSLFHSLIRALHFKGA